MKQIDPTKLILAGATALFLTAAASSIAPAQAPMPATTVAVPQFKNLKVFPADIPRAQLIDTMKGFTQSLGVRCTFCHVGEEGKRETMDFPSDAKEHKLIARSMMRLVGQLNSHDLPAIQGLKDARVTCYTCHRGDSKPAIVPPSASPAPAS